MKELFSLFGIFARMGAVTFGGGYAMLPILQDELVDKRKWVTEEEILDYYAIGQCTPGIIAVNVSTFVGYKRRGIPGAIFSTLGMVFPSLVIITIIAAFINNFASLAVVQHALAGIRVAVAVLVISAVIKMWKSAVVDKIGLVIYLVVLGLMLWLDVTPIVFVVAALITGIIVKKVGAKRQ